MAKLGINTTPPLGTPLPDGGGFINSNFDELYTLLGDGNELYPGIVTSITAGSNISISTNYGNVTIDVSNSAFTETLDTVTDRGNVTTNGIRVGVATASAFVKTGGTSSQFLKADGSVDSNTYLTSASSINLDLDDVTSNGNTTANNIQVGSLVALGNVAAGASILAVNAAYASSFRRIGGSADEFLKGDGSVDTLTNVGIGTSSGEESLIVGGDVRILGILTVGSASITIDGDAEMISVGSTVSIGNSGITVGSGVTINDEGVFIQGQPVIDRWMIEGAGISTTANVGIGTIADAARQLKVDGTTELYNLRVAKEGAGIRLDQTGGIDNDGDNFHIWATQNLFLEAGGAGTGTGRGIRILNDTDTVFVDHDLTVDHDIVVGGGVSAVGVVTASFFEGDGSRITNIAGAGDTTGLASIIYVDNAVGLATAGLASIAYVDNLVAISTAGLGTGGGVGAAVTISDTAPGSPSEGDLWWDSTRGTGFIYYTDTNSSQWVEFCPGGGTGGNSGIGTLNLASITYVDTTVGLATQGLASIAYVDQEIANVATADTTGLASIEYVDTQVGLATAGISTEGLASIAYVDTKVGLATDGLATEDYVDATEQSIITQVGSLLNMSYYTKTEVDTKVGLSTVGLASTDYVNAAVAGVVGGASTTTWTLSAQGTDNYMFDGPGFNGPTPDPNLTLIRGQKYNFVNNMGAHPFRIQSTQGTSGTPYNDGITNNGVSNGTLEWDVQFDSPNTLYYQCTAHPNMQGEIYVLSNVGSGDTTGLASTSYVDNKVGLATVGLASTDYVDFAVSGVSTFAVLTTDLAVVNPFNASLTVGQNINGTPVDHFGIYYGNTTGDKAAELFTAEGDMSFWLDGGGTDNNSLFTFGREFGANTYLSLNSSGAEFSGIVTATSFVGDGSNLTGVGGALPSRSTLSGTTGVINPGNSTFLDISGYKTYALQTIQATQASWVRIYTDPTSRLNDASRLYTEDPQPGSGLIAEVRTETSGTSTFIMSPGVIGWNNNNTSNIYLAVTNNESSALTITVNLQAVQMEA